MKQTARLVLTVIAVLLTGAIVMLAARGDATSMTVTFPTYDKPPREHAEILKQRPVGMSGCLAAACHGSPAEKTLAGHIDMNTWQASGTAWIAADPHAAAYSLLTDHPIRPVKVTAQQIMSHYAPGTKATEDARCLACHTNPTLASKQLIDEPHARMLRVEGVSCESCHGNAGAWVSDHTTWKGDRKEVYANSGMVPLYDLGERAMNCLGCHVGAPEDKQRGLPVRDMNHDMIAAGHPRLNFDYAEYLRRLPPHWHEKDRMTEPPKLVTLNPAKVWYLGRVAHAEAACLLLADRAERSQHDERTPWPEFAEYNCAACHHNLKAPERVGVEPPWRQDRAYIGSRTPGVPPWQTIWPLTPAAGIESPSRESSPLADVLAPMEKPRHPKVGIADAARKTALTLRTQRQQLLEMTDPEIVKKSTAVFPPSGSPRYPEWDSAAQLFFGYAAMERARGTRVEALPHFQKALNALRTEQWPEFDWRALTSALDAIRQK